MDILESVKVFSTVSETAFAPGDEITLTVSVRMEGGHRPPVHVYATVGAGLQLKGRPIPTSKFKVAVKNTFTGQEASDHSWHVQADPALLAAIPRTHVAAGDDPRGQVVLTWNVKLQASSRIECAQGHVIKVWIAAPDDSTKQADEIKCVITPQPTTIQNVILEGPIQRNDNEGQTHGSGHAKYWIGDSKGAITLKAETATPMELDHAYIALSVGSESLPIKRGSAQGNLITVTDAFHNFPAISNATSVIIKVRQTSDDGAGVDKGWSEPYEFSLEKKLSVPNVVAWLVYSAEKTDNRIESANLRGTLTLRALVDAEPNIENVEFRVGSLPWQPFPADAADGAAWTYSFDLANTLDLSGGVEVRATDKLGNQSAVTKATFDSSVFAVEWKSLPDWRVNQVNRVEVNVTSCDSKLVLPGITRFELRWDSDGYAERTEPGSKYPMQLTIAAVPDVKLLGKAITNRKITLIGPQLGTVIIEAPDAYKGKYRLPLPAFRIKGSEARYDEPILMTRHTNRLVVIGEFANVPVALQGHKLEFQYSKDRHKFADLTRVEHTAGDRSFSVYLPDENFPSGQHDAIHKYEHLTLRVRYGGDGARVEDYISQEFSLVVDNTRAIFEDVVLDTRDTGGSGVQFIARGKIKSSPAAGHTVVGVYMSWDGQVLPDDFAGWTPPVASVGNPELRSFDLSIERAKVKGPLSPTLYAKTQKGAVSQSGFAFPNAHNLVDVGLKVKNQVVQVQWDDDAGQFFGGHVLPQTDFDIDLEIKLDAALHELNVNFEVDLSAIHGGSYELAPGRRIIASPTGSGIDVSQWEIGVRGNTQIASLRELQGGSSYKFTFPLHYLKSSSSGPKMDSVMKLRVVLIDPRTGGVAKGFQAETVAEITLK